MTSIPNPRFTPEPSLLSKDTLKEIAQLKDVSHNLTHSNLRITDRIYGVLSAGDVKKQIPGLGDPNGPDESSKEELLELAKALLTKTKS